MMMAPSNWLIYEVILFWGHSLLTTQLVQFQVLSSGIVALVMAKVKGYIWSNSKTTENSFQRQLGGPKLGKTIRSKMLFKDPRGRHGAWLLDSVSDLAWVHTANNWPWNKKQLTTRVIQITYHAWLEKAFVIDASNMVIVPSVTLCPPSWWDRHAGEEGAETEGSECCRSIKWQRPKTPIETLTWNSWIWAAPDKSQRKKPGLNFVILSCQMLISIKNSEPNSFKLPKWICWLKS